VKLNKNLSRQIKSIEQGIYFREYFFLFVLKHFFDTMKDIYAQNDEFEKADGCKELVKKIDEELNNFEIDE